MRYRKGREVSRVYDLVLQEGGMNREGNTRKFLQKFR
jgi:hypothetical protein